MSHAHLCRSDFSQRPFISRYPVWIPQCVTWALICASLLRIQLCPGPRDEPARSHQENQPLWAPDILPAHTEGDQDPAAFQPWEHHRYQWHLKGSPHRQYEGRVSFPLTCLSDPSWACTHLSPLLLGFFCQLLTFYYSPKQFLIVIGLTCCWSI